MNEYGFCIEPRLYNLDQFDTLTRDSTEPMHLS
jgi:hypothetical protein